MERAASPRARLARPAPGPRRPIAGPPFFGQAVSRPPGGGGEREEEPAGAGAAGGTRGVPVSRRSVGGRGRSTETKKNVAGRVASSWQEPAAGRRGGPCSLQGRQEQRGPAARLLALRPLSRLPALRPVSRLLGSCPSPAPPRRPSPPVPPPPRSSRLPRRGKKKNRQR